MTTCSSLSDNPDTTSTSDVEEGIDLNPAIGELSLGHVLEGDKGRNRLSSPLRTADSQCDGDITVGYTVTSLSHSKQQTMETDAECNGIITNVDVQLEQTLYTSSSPSEISNGQLHDGVTVCLANGSVSEIPAASTANIITSSQEQISSCVAYKSDECINSLSVDPAVSEPASDTHCTSDNLSSELKPSLTSSIPLLSIPQTDHTRADDKSFSILPSLSSVTADDTMVRVMPPSVFSVPCMGRESDGFTDVSLDDDIEQSRRVSTLNVPATGLSELSRDCSPSRPRLATSSSSSLHLDDAIVQSVLCDDDDDNDASRTIGSSRHSASIAFATNTDSAAFRTPVCTAASADKLKEDGLRVVEPDSVSFEEISLQSYSASDSHSISPDQTATSSSKRSSIANFFAR